MPLEIGSVKSKIEKVQGYNCEPDGFTLNLSVESNSREFLEKVARAIHKELAEASDAFYNPGGQAVS